MNKLIQSLHSNITWNKKNKKNERISNLDKGLIVVPRHEYDYNDPVEMRILREL